MREENIHIFTPEMLEKMAYIWTRSSISLIDVRHQSIYPAQPLRQYKMPSSMLVYAYGGIANVQLNEAIFSMERFGLFHGGKGTTLASRLKRWYSEATWCCIRQRRRPSSRRTCIDCWSR